MTAPQPPRRGGPPRRIPPTAPTHVGQPQPPRQGPPRRHAQPPQQPMSYTVYVQPGQGQPQGHHFSGRPPRNPQQRQAPRPSPAAAATQARVDRVVSERGGLYAADGQFRKPRAWHLAAAGALALFVVSNLMGSMLVGFAALGAGIGAGVLAWRRSKEAARHMSNVRLVEHFIRAVPRGGEAYAEASNLRAVAQAGFAASNYLVHERVFFGAPDGQPVMDRAMTYRDASNRARAELERRYPTAQTVMQQQLADEDDDVAAPVTYKPESEDDSEPTDDWRDALATDTQEDW